MPVPIEIYLQKQEEGQYTVRRTVNTLRHIVGQSLTKAEVKDMILSGAYKTIEIIDKTPR